MSKPKLIHLICCDTAVQDRMTGKWTLVGLFNGVKARLNFSFWVFMTISGMPQECKFSILFEIDDVEVAKQELAGRMDMNVKSNKQINPRQRFEFAVRIPTLAFKRTGDCQVKVFANDELIGQDTLIVS